MNIDGMILDDEFAKYLDESEYQDFANWMKNKGSVSVPGNYTGSNVNKNLVDIFRQEKQNNNWNAVKNSAKTLLGNNAYSI